MITIQNFRDGSIGLLWRDLRRTTYWNANNPAEAVVRALIDGRAPDWALGDDADIVVDEDGVRLHRRDDF